MNTTGITIYNSETIPSGDNFIPGVPLSVFKQLGPVIVPGALQEATIICTSELVLDSEILRGLFRALAPNATLKVIYPEEVTDDQLKEAKKEALVEGFLKASKSGNEIHLNKPNWSVGSGKKLSEKPVETKTNETKTNTWADLKESVDQDNLIQEDDLLEGEDEYKKLASSSDCMTKPKACKNCTCGRAELENAAEIEALEKGNVKSSCGKCNLGDAFRCATCPYRGLPAFKVGEQVKLDLAGTTSLAGVEAEKKTAVSNTGNQKVQISMDDDI